MKRVFTATVCLFLMLSLAGCCCRKYRNCCGYGPGYVSDGCCGDFGGCGAAQGGCGGCQGQAFDGSGGYQTMVGNGNCPHCQSSHSTMMGPGYNGQPVPMYSEQYNGHPVPAPPSEETTIPKQSAAFGVGEPAPLPAKDAARLRTTQQLQWVPSNL